MNTTFQGLCEAAAERWEVPALVVGELVAERASTLALGCDATARFRVASVTKPLTATLATRLLDLDAATGVWPDDVRVRQLLSHTSGYDSECGDLSRFGAGEDALERVVAELPSVRRLVPPGSVWSYANSGYWLAGLLCARAADASYEEALAAHVLRPAGLEATGFGEPDLPGTGPSAGAGPYPRARRPSGGLVSTAGDLLGFARAHLADPAAAALRIPLARPPAGVYGLGLAGERVGGVEVWGHNGSYGGFQSSLLLVPDRRAALVGLTNSDRGALALREVEDAWFARVLGARRRPARRVSLSAEALEAFAGTYVNSSSTVTVSVEGDGLLVRAEDEVPQPLSARPIGPRSFQVVGGDIDGHRFDFPLEGFVRIGSRLHERTP